MTIPSPAGRPAMGERMTAVREALLFVDTPLYDPAMAEVERWEHDLAWAKAAADEAIKRAERAEAALRTLGVTEPQHIEWLAEGLRPGTAGWVLRKLTHWSLEDE